MKYINLCVLLILLCTTVSLAFAENDLGAKAASDAYAKAVATLEREREQKKQEGLKQKEQLKRMEEDASTQEAERQAESAALQKECGKDYGEIRVGMKLARVQRCVGEFFLSGQRSSKYGTVDYYTRGDAYLFVKKGKVVAWGN